MTGLGPAMTMGPRFSFISAMRGVDRRICPAMTPDAVTEHGNHDCMAGRVSTVRRPPREALSS